MSNSPGRLPGNFPNLVVVMPAVMQTHGAHHLHQHRIDPFIGQIASQVFNQITILPIPPIEAPDEGFNGSPGGGQEGEVEGGEKPAIGKGGEGKEYIPPIGKHHYTGDLREIRDVPAKMERAFKEEVLKVAESLLPDQNKGANLDKGQRVDMVAETVETKGAETLEGFAKRNDGYQPSKLQAPGEGDLKTTEIHPPHTGALEKQNPSQMGTSFSQVGSTQADGSLIATANQENSISLGTPPLIPVESSLTKDGIQSIAQVVPKEGIATGQPVHKGAFDGMTTPAQPQTSDLQGLNTGLVVPLGVLPVTPAHVVTTSNPIGGKRDDMAIDGLVQRSLHQETLRHPSGGETIPLLIPSDRTDLHRIPDGREIMFILQMAQMGQFRGKKVEDSSFRLPDGMKLDPGYKLGDLLTISYFAILSGAASLTQIGAFVDEQEEWIASNFDMRRGIPSPLVFMWLFSRITPYYLPKMILQHIECITDRKRGRQSPFNGIRIWETNQGLIFGRAKEEGRSLSQNQLIRAFDWKESTLILEPAEDPEEVKNNVPAKLLLSVNPDQKEKLLPSNRLITTKTEEWNEAFEVACSLQLSLFPEWTLGKFTRIQEGALKMSRSFISNLPIDFSAWSTLFYPRTDVEEQTVWVGEGRFSTHGDLTISHAIDNFNLLCPIAYKAVLNATTLSGSVEQKRGKFWEDPDELLIMIHY